MKGLIQSFRYAIQGFCAAVRRERNLKIHLSAMAVAFVLALWLGFTAGELAVLTLICALVIICELINTAIEAAVDLACPKQNPLAGFAKDVAAAAVFISALAAVVCALVLYIPYIKNLWGS